MRRCHVAVAAAILSVASFSSCDWFISAGDPRVSYVDEPLSLVGIDEAAVSRSVAGSRAAVSRAAKPAPGGAALTLVAEIEAPLGADGAALQASHVFLQPNGKHALVSYMTQGAGVGGALDLLDVTSDPRRPRLLDTVSFPDFDVAVVYEQGGTIYLGGHERDVGASVKSLALRSTSIDETELAERSLPGVFATDLALVGNSALYVTTGADLSGVGLYKLAASDLSDLASLTAGLPDARSLAATTAGIFVYDAALVGSGSRVVRLNDNSLAIAAEQDLDAYPAQAEAKSKLAVGKNGSSLFLAVNTSGLLVMDPVTLAVTARLPAPLIAGIPSERLSTNAAAFGFAKSKDIVLVANGEGGLWVGDAAALSSATSDTALSAISGTIRFDVDQSVNFADAKNNVIVVACGLGGVKVVLME